MRPRVQLSGSLARAGLARCTRLDRAAHGPPAGHVLVGCEHPRAVGAPEMSFKRARQPLKHGVPHAVGARAQSRRHVVPGRGCHRHAADRYGALSILGIIPAT
eukprot:scaffold23788_cov126-Isochrysis_galbana.AAC.2